MTIRPGWAEGEGSFKQVEDMATEVVKAIEEGKTSEDGVSPTSLVSIIAEVPAPLKKAMTVFIQEHPNWDQYRLVQAALAGFLAQSGHESRAITRLYLDNMFSKKID